jgi:hypothetical protein
MPEPVWYRTKPTHSGIFLLRYRPEMMDAGSVSSMPMLSEGHFSSLVAALLEPGIICCFKSEGMALVQCDLK